jgi:hypothetical protein
VMYAKAKALRVDPASLRGRREPTNAELARDLGIRCDALHEDNLPPSTRQALLAWHNLWEKQESVRTAAEVSDAMAIVGGLMGVKVKNDLVHPRAENINKPRAWFDQRAHRARKDVGESLVRDGKLSQEQLRAKDAALLAVLLLTTT